MISREKLEGYLVKLELTFQEAGKGTWVVREPEKGLASLFIMMADPLVVLRLTVMEAPKKGREQLFEELLHLNATDMVHGAYALDGKNVVIVDTLEGDTLDVEELQASIEAISLAVVQHHGIHSKYPAQARRQEDRMGILERIRTVLKSNINALISKAENPEKMLNQLIIDMNESLVEAKRQVAMAIADEKKLERQLLENRGMSGEWEGKAMLAVKAGKDDLAKEALVRKGEYDGYASGYQKEYDSQHAAVEQLKDALRQLSAKIEEASRKKNLLVARAKRAEAQKQIQSTMGSLSNTSSFDTFERMAEKVDQIEAEASALGEINKITGDQKLEDKFKELEGPASADAALEELKKKMAQLEQK